jgi:hypothetical protein
VANFFEPKRYLQIDRDPEVTFHRFTALHPEGVSGQAF